MLVEKPEKRTDLSNLVTNRYKNELESKDESYVNFTSIKYEQLPSLFHQMKAPYGKT
jgi:hypothetical protein